ncbi:MAG: ABC transporter permease [Candidatus Omnitrophica bacterium]|nr:ABC transporter permease [Candidatus Omnitrophota bacterium]
MSWRRIQGVFFRHFYLWRHNADYVLDTLWHPVVDLLIWGFVTLYLKEASSQLGWMTSTLLAAVILWAILRRGQHEITFGLMEEAWSRNLLNFFTTPVTLADFLVGTACFGLIKLVIELTLMTFLAWILFGQNLVILGIQLIPFLVSLLMTGWVLGLFVNTLLIRFGRGLVALSWIMAFALQPFACVFYPVEALPLWAQAVARLLPCTYVFEGMRSLVSGQGGVLGNLVLSFVLNAVYLILGLKAFRGILVAARRNAWLPRLES